MISAYLRKSFLPLCAGLFALGLAPGCRRGEPAGGPSRGSWQVVSAEPRPGGQSAGGTGQPIPRLAVAIAGDVGFARATVAVERIEGGSGPRAEVYDILFPVGAEALLAASVEEVPGQPQVARVRVRAESGVDSSTSFVEPNVPLLAEGAEVTLQGIVAPDRRLAEGEEVELGRWEVRSGAVVARVAIRVLLSKRPTGPRLKPEGKPPV